MSTATVTPNVYKNVQAQCTTSSVDTGVYQWLYYGNPAYYKLLDPTATGFVSSFGSNTVSAENTVGSVYPPHNIIFSEVGFSLTNVLGIIPDHVINTVVFNVPLTGVVGTFTLDVFKLNGAYPIDTGYSDPWALIYAYNVGAGISNTNTLVGSANVTGNGTYNISISDLTLRGSCQYVLRLRQVSDHQFPTNTTVNTTVKVSGVIGTVTATVNYGASLYPAPPTSVTVVGIDCDTATVSFTPPSPLPTNGYQLRWNVDGLVGVAPPGGYLGPADSSVTIASNLSSIVISGIDAKAAAVKQATGNSGRAVYAAIYSSNGGMYKSNETLGNTSTDIIHCATPPTVPAPPTGLTVSMGSSTANLIWIGSAGATGYKVKAYLTTVGGSSVPLIDVGNVLSYQVIGLTPSSAYTFEVYAYNAQGNSATPAMVAGTTTASGAGSTSPPTNLAATAGDGQVNLTWTASVTAGASYEITMNPGNVVTTATATSWNATGLTNGTTYSFSVVAIAAGVRSSSTGPVSATPTGTPPSGNGVFDWIMPVNYPTGTMGNSDSGVVIGSWKSKGGIAQPIPNGYKLNVFSVADLTNILWTKTVNTWVPDTVECAGTNCIPIQSSVAASNYIPIDTHILTDGNIPPVYFLYPRYTDGTLGPALAIGGIAAQLNTDYLVQVLTLDSVNVDGGADLTWTVGTVGIPANHFRVKIFHNGSYDQTLSSPYSNVSSSARTLQLRGLTNGTHYTIALQAIDAKGNQGPPANVVDIYPQVVTGITPPVDPATLTLTPHQNTIDAVWAASATATKYEISYSLNANGPFTNAIVLNLNQLTFSGGNYSYTIPGLSSATTYYVKIKAGNVSNTGVDQWSTPGIVRNTTTLSTVSFDAVEVNTASSVASDTTLSLVWSTPGNHGIGPLTQYQVYYKKASDVSYQVTTVTATTALTNSTNLTGLDSNTVYDIYIIATNSAGETSPRISDVTITTLTTSDINRPIPVIMLTGIEEDPNPSGQAPYTFTWSDSLDQTLQSYNLYVYIWNIDPVTGNTVGDPLLQVFNTTLNNYTVLASKSRVRVAAFVTVVATRTVRGLDKLYESDASNTITVVAIDDSSSDVRTATVSAYAFYDLDNPTNPNLLLSTRIRKQFSSNTDITTLNKIDVENSLYNPLDLLIEKIDSTSGFDREFVFSSTSYDISVNNWQYINEVGFAYLPIPDYGIPVATYLTLNKTDEPMGMFKATNPCSYKITSINSANIFAELGKVFLSKEAYRTINGNVDKLLATVPLTKEVAQSSLTNIELNASYDSVNVIDNKTSILPLRFLIDVDRSPLTQSKLPTGHNDFIIDRKLNVETSQCGGISAIVKYVEKRAPGNFTLAGYQNALYLDWDVPIQPSLILKSYQISGYFYEKNPVTNVTQKRIIGSLDDQGNFVPYITLLDSDVQSYLTRINYVLNSFKYIKEESPTELPSDGTIDPNKYYTMQINASYDYRGHNVAGPKTYELSMRTSDIPSQSSVRASILGLDVVWPVIVNTYLTQVAGGGLPTEDHFPRITLLWNKQHVEILWRDLVNYTPVSGDVWFMPQSFTLASTISYINAYLLANHPSVPIVAFQSGTQLAFKLTSSATINDTLEIHTGELDPPVYPQFVIPGGLSILGTTPTVIPGGNLPKVYISDPPRNTNIFVGKNSISIDWKEPENTGGSPIYKYVVSVTGDNAPAKSYVIYKNQNLIGVKHYKFDAGSVGPVLPNMQYTISVSAFNSQYESLHASLGPVQIADVLRWTKVDFNTTYITAATDRAYTASNQRNQMVARPVIGDVPITYNTLYKQETALTTERNLLANQPWQYAEERLTILPRINFDAIETHQPIGITLNNKNIQPGSLTIWYATDNTAVISDVGNGKLTDASGEALVRPAYIDECGDTIPAQKVGIVDYENGIISCYMPNLKNSKVLITYRYKEVSINTDDYIWFSTPVFDLEVKTQLFPLTYPHLTYILKNVNRIKPATSVVRNFTVK